MAEHPAESISPLPCPACGKLVEPERKFCPFCGAPQHPESEQKAPLLLCFSCGDELPTEATFCGSCGTRVRQDKTAPTLVAPTPGSLPPSSAETASFPSHQPQAANHMRTILIGMGIGLGVAILFCIGIVVGKLFFSPVGPEPPPPPPPEARGQVVTVDGLFPIRVFGDAANDRVRLTSSIKERIEGLLTGIRSAYEKELEASPHLLGVLIMEVTIAADGHVSRVTSHATSLSGQEFQRIVRDFAQEWRFEPAATGEVNVFYPFLFAPVDIDHKALISFVNEVIPGRYKIIAAEPVPVREEPNETATQLGEVKPGLKVNIISSQGSWLGIVSPQGKIGYLPRAAVSAKVDAQ